MPEDIQANPVGALVRKYQEDWVAGSTQVSKYVSVDFYDDIQTIEAYLNSKHTTGEKDSLQRDKPFFNIVLAARNIWARATDLDRKNFRIKAGKRADVLASYLVNIHLQRWMRDADFGTFLNQWGMYLASYNSCIVKFVENSKGLTPSVIDWNAVMCDIINFEQNPVVEVLYLTPSQLKKNKSYDKEMVKGLIESQGTTRETQEGQKKDTKSNYIKVYEVHGEMPLSYLTGKEEDDEEYVQQMHVVSFTAGKDGQWNDFTLYSGQETKNPYMLTWLIPSIDGSVSLDGSVKSLFQEQWMKNHSIKNTKDYLDMVSKVVLQTSDSAYAGRNVLKNIEQGQIMVFDSQKSPITPINYGQHSIEALVNFGQMWQDNANSKASTPDVMQGENMPSGTAYRQAAIIQTEAHSNFKLMTQNKGLHLERMGKEWILPYLLKQMDTTEEIVATLNDYGIDKIDMMYISNEATKRFNEKAVEAVINETELPNLVEEEQGVKKELQMLGGDRYLKPSEITTKTWEDVIGKFEGDAVYEITNENQDKQAILDTLVTTLQTISQNPMVLQDPVAKKIFGSILEETGKLNPVEISEMETPQPVMAQPPQPMMGQVGGANGVQAPQVGV